MWSPIAFVRPAWTPSVSSAQSFWSRRTNASMWRTCRNGWYHRSCLQMYVNTSGYFFKGSLCNNTGVPQRDPHGRPFVYPGLRRRIPTKHSPQLRTQSPWPTIAIMSSPSCIPPTRILMMVLTPRMTWKWSCVWPKCMQLEKDTQ